MNGKKVERIGLGIVEQKWFPTKINSQNPRSNTWSKNPYNLIYNRQLFDIWMDQPGTASEKGAIHDQV